jgi:hypothetical protein
MTLRINGLNCDTTCQSECGICIDILSVLMFNDSMVSVIMIGVVMLSVIKLTVVMLSVIILGIIIKVLLWWSQSYT